jgi:hypothetical protein
LGSESARICRDIVLSIILQLILHRLDKFLDTYEVHFEATKYPSPFQ